MSNILSGSAGMESVESMDCETTDGCEDEKKDIVLPTKHSRQPH